MYNGGKIITGLVIFLLLLLFPFWWQHGQEIKAPVLELSAKAKETNQCVEATTFMKTQHMKVLDRWRDEVVRQDKRLYKSQTGKDFNMSLQNTCMECHANKTQFCDQCHNFVGIAPYCWNCHIAPKENI